MTRAARPPGASPAGSNGSPGFGTDPGIGLAGRNRIYALLFLLTAISYVDRTTLSVAAPFVAAEFDISPVGMGYLFSSFLWTYILFLIPVGILVDRYGARIVAAGGVSVWSAATIGSGLSNSFAALLASRLVLGAGESTAYPAGVRVVRDHAPESERGLGMAFLNGGSYAGPAFGALLTGWLVAAFGWRWGFVVIGLLGFLWVPPWLLWLRNRSTDRPARPAPVATASPAAAGLIAAGPAALPSTPLRMLLRRREIWGMAVTQGCAVYAQYLFLAWLPSYLQDVKGLVVQDAGLFTAIPYLVSVPASLLICRASDRMIGPQGVAAGQRRYMVGLTMLLAAAVLLAPMVESMVTITVLIAVSLTGISSAISLNFALAGDLLDAPSDAGKVASLLVLGGNIFGVLAPIVTGHAIAATGSYDPAFAIAGLMVVAGAGVSILVVRPRARR